MAVTVRLCHFDSTDLLLPQAEELNAEISAPDTPFVSHVNWEKHV